MAIKKYVSLEKLSLYDEKIKKLIADGDSAALAAAKDYSDSLADNYDVAGAAATALADAKVYADGKDEAIAAAKKAGDDAAAAAAIADGKAVAAQTDVDNLEGVVDNLDKYVGKIPEGYTESNVIAYINKKAQETLDTASGGSSESAASVLAALNTYKAENDPKVQANTDAIAEVEAAVATEKSRAEGVEAGLETRLANVEKDYLTSADRTDIEEQIATNASAIERLTNGVSQEEIDGVNDLIQYVKDHGTEVTGIQEDIAENAAAIAAEAERAAAEEAKNATAAANAMTAAQNAQTAIDAEIERATGVEGGLNTRLTAVETAIGESGSVAEDIAAAKQEAIDIAAEDATSKANAAETAAKNHANSMNTAMNARVEALEAIDHDHTNKAELDLIASGDKAKWDAAAAIAHEHSNLSVLEGITSTKVAAWDAAEGNAKTYANGLNTAMDTRVVALETWHNNFIEVSEAEINALFN